MKKIARSLVLGLSAVCLSISVAFAQNAQGTADFEGLLSKKDTNWHGDRDGITYFESGAFKFANRYTAAWDVWSGVAYANIESHEYIDSLGYGNQYKNVAGGGAEGSESYGILYDTAYIFYTGDTLKGVRLGSCRLTNNMMLYHTAMNGDDFAGEPFKTGDFFKVIFTAFSPKGNVSQKEFYLADYRDEDAAKHYIFTTWESVDLSSLGFVKKLMVTFEGSRVGQFGQNLPLYAAIDNLSVNENQEGEDPEPAGVENTAALLDRLYPVPAKDVLHIETAQENCRVEIFSVQGRKMAEYRMNGTRFSLPVQSYAAGLYILKLSHGNQMTVSRFVVNR